MNIKLMMTLHHKQHFGTNHSKWHHNAYFTCKYNTTIISSLHAILTGIKARWPHNLEMLSISLALCEGIHPWMWFPAPRASYAELWCFLVVSLNKWLHKRPSYRWARMSFLWRHCNVVTCVSDCVGNIIMHCLWKSSVCYLILKISSFTVIHE